MSSHHGDAIGTSGYFMPNYHGDALGTLGRLVPHHQPQCRPLNVRGILSPVTVVPPLEHYVALCPIITVTPSER